MRALLLLLVCAGAAAAATAGANDEWSKPDFCGQRDCPRFQLLEKADGYETRRYNASWWVWARFEDVTGWDIEEAAMKASAEVFSYFLGGNKDEKTIEMGAPLAHNFTMRERKGRYHGAGWTTVSKRKHKEHVDVTVKMYLPYSFQDGKEKPPAPSSKHVHIDEFPEWTAHVRGWKGWPTPHNFEKEMKTLMDYLEEDDRDFSDQWVICSVYNAGHEISHRYNEVLFPAEPGKKGRRGGVA